MTGKRIFSSGRPENSPDRTRGCRTKKLVRSLFYVQKNYSQTSKSLAVGVKYKYAKTYITTQELYFE